MHINFARSSSISEYKDYCETSYMMKYVLGIKSNTNIKTEVGTAYHCVMECLAICKKYHQDNPKSKEVKVDSPLGKINVSVEDMYKISKIGIRELSDINKSRINKSVYLYDAQLKDGATRVGANFVQDLIKRSTYKYAEASENEWLATNFKNVQNFVWMNIELGYDPRFQKIIQPEQKFNINLEDFEWSRYKYEINGKKYEGHYNLAGTIDLIIEDDDGYYNIIDYKSGQRKNWGTGQIKDFNYLSNDPQLTLYQWAAQKIYPDKEFCFTIIWVRDGGPYQLMFGPEHMKNVEESLEYHFKSVVNNKKPKMIHPQQKDFRCTKLCHFYKNNWPGKKMNMCNFIHDSIDKNGIDKTIDLYQNIDFEMGYYERGDI